MNDEPIKYRDSEGRLVRGNIRTVHIDPCEGDATLYDEHGKEVPWPEGWPTWVFRSSFTQLGIRIIG